MIGVRGGNLLAQITVVEGFAPRRISSLFFGPRDKTRERTNAKMYHNRRVD